MLRPCRFSFLKRRDQGLVLHHSGLRQKWCSRASSLVAAPLVVLGHQLCNAQHLRWFRSTSNLTRKAGTSPAASHMLGHSPSGYVTVYVRAWQSSIAWSNFMHERNLTSSPGKGAFLLNKSASFAGCPSGYHHTVLQRSLRQDINPRLVSNIMLEGNSRGSDTGY